MSGHWKQLKGRVQTLHHKTIDKKYWHTILKLYENKYKHKNYKSGGG